MPPWNENRLGHKSIVQTREVRAHKRYGGILGFAFSASKTWCRKFSELPDVPREHEESLPSVQGALSIARPPEVSRFGSFVKPTTDWF